MTTLLNDIKYAFRQLRKNPGFTAVAVLSLTLGIGANTAIFNLVNAVLLRSLPVQKAQELALLSPTGVLPGTNVGWHGFSYPVYRELRERNEVFEGLFCRFRFAANVSWGSDTQRVMAEMVSGNYFEVLGVPAVIGRTISSEDDLRVGAHPVAVLSHTFWRNAFGADPNILGRTLQVNGYPLTVIGVTTKGFSGVELDITPQIYMPMMMTDEMIPFMSWISIDNPLSRWIQVFGRLKPGLTHEQARASLKPIYSAVMESILGSEAMKGQSESNKNRMLESSIEVYSGKRGLSELRGTLAMPLCVLMAMVGLVLLLACVNVAGLLVGRGIQRQPEFAVRMAVGAGRGGLVSQLFIESMLLVVLGSVIGLLAVPWITQLLVQFVPSRDGSVVFTAVDGRVLGFSLVISAIAVMMFGLVPAFMSTRLNLVSILRQHVVGGPAYGSFRRLLVSVQVGLSLVLLIGAALFTRSLHNLCSLDPGFETSTVVTFGVDPVLNGYPRAQSEDTYRRLKERLETIPGVESAGFGLVRVLAGDVWDSAISIEGYKPKPGGNAFAFMNTVSADYFRTLGIPLVAGRDFRPSDRADVSHVAIVNESFAKRYFDGGNAIGRRLGLNGPNSATDTEIIGVVRDAKYNGVREDIPPQAFIPYQQLFTIMGMNGYVRSRIPAEGIFSAIRQAVREVDPSLPIHEMRTLDAQRDRSLTTERLLALLTSAFGILASSLAAIGLYGVLNYSVTRRTRELGLRMALGARGGNIMWTVLKEVLLLCSIGMAVALPAALALGHLIASQLYGVVSSDPGAICAAILLFATVAALACVIPTRRAAKIDPMEALRYE